MFSTFTKKHLEAGETARDLVIRGETIKRLEDTNKGCVVVWVEESMEERLIEGTARENLERLKAEELKILDEHQRLQQRQAQGLPLQQVQRGRPQ